MYGLIIVGAPSTAVPNHVDKFVFKINITVKGPDTPMALFMLVGVKKEEEKSHLTFRRRRRKSTITVDPLLSPRGVW